MPATNGRGAFDSGLTTPDFAACLQMGLQPISLVQGFYFGQLSGWSANQAAVHTRYPCGHYPRHDYNEYGWLGTLDNVDGQWQLAFETAEQRLVDEATKLGAHGVVGVQQRLSHPTSQQSVEVHLFGTAVVVKDAPPPQRVWCTRIAGHKLAKLIEIGCVPAALVFARSTAVLYGGCELEYFEHGYANSGIPVGPLNHVNKLSRQNALSSARRQIGNDSLYDVEMQTHEYEAGTMHVITTITGSRVRHVAAADPLPVPLPTLSLS